jgi:thiomorpholine-carboxylate dehydrogenase
METTLAAFSRGEIVQPVRDIIAVDEGRRYLGVMPAVAGDVMGLKLVSFYPINAGGPNPTHNATIVLYRTETGQPLAAMDGRLITEMRTAAVSAAVTARMAPPQTRVLGLIGSGVQAHAHLQALRRVRTFEEVRVWSRTPEHADRFARTHGVRAVESPKAAVSGADVVVTVTSSRQPVVEGAWLKAGAHVNAVGSCRPDWRELDDEAMRNAVLVDSRDAAKVEAGDVILSGARIYAEVGEIFNGSVAAPQAQTTIFKSLGLACEDLAAARLVADRKALLASERPV